MLAWGGWIAAVFMGVTLGLIGGGGSILAVPILVYLLDVEPVRATGYSLFVVGATALVGAGRCWRAGLVDSRSVLVFGIPALAGVYAVRRWLMPALPDPILARGDLAIGKGLFVMLVFAVVMAVAAGSMIASRRPAARGGSSPRALPLATLDGLAVGAVTGFVGAGGGFLIVPALVFLRGLPVRTAIGTSLAVIALKSLVGFVGEVQETRDPEWSLLLPFALLAVAGVGGGAELNRRIPAERLRPLFGWFVLAMAVVIFVTEVKAP